MTGNLDEGHKYMAHNQKCKNGKYSKSRECSDLKLKIDQTVVIPFVENATRMRDTHSL